MKRSRKKIKQHINEPGSEVVNNDEPFHSLAHNLLESVLVTYKQR